MPMQSESGSAVGDLANRRSSESFRQLASLRLQLLGLDGAHPTPVQRPVRPSEAVLRDVEPEPHIDGLGERWHVGTLASVRQARFSSALDAVRRDAALRGAEHAFLIAYRRERPISEAFALTTLDGLAGLILETEAARA